MHIGSTFIWSYPLFPNGALFFLLFFLLTSHLLVPVISHRDLRGRNPQNKTFKLLNIKDKTHNVGSCLLDNYSDQNLGVFREEDPPECPPLLEKNK